MDVDTLLTRQMELHTTTRNPPKSPEQLIQLRKTLLEYSRFFKQLGKLSDELNTNRIIVFQSFLHVSVGGAVQFDKQKQSGEVPMHQAKVLTRTAAVELEPVLREHLPNAELMILVGLTKDLRTALRVKVEDENDLKTAQKGIEDSVEYLNFIHSHSGGDPQKMFAFYMVEDGPSLVKMIDDADSSAEVCMSPSLNSTLCDGAVPQSMLVQEWHPKMDLPSLEVFLGVLATQMEIVVDFKGHQASERVVVLENLVEWLSSMPDEDFVKVYAGILQETMTPFAKLCCDNRSSLCRVTCELIVLVSRRLSLLSNTVYLQKVTQLYEDVLEAWVSSLLTGIYVTVSAISSATDHAIRELILINHGPVVIVKRILSTLEQKKQTELRRKCLGYLAMSVAAAEVHRAGSSSGYCSLIVTVAEQYVEIGDSPSRKMARSLCTVLRGVACCQLHVVQKVEQLIQKEETQLKPFFADPELLGQHLFEVCPLNASINSFGSTFDISSPSLTKIVQPRVQAVRVCPREYSKVASPSRETGGRRQPLIRKRNVSKKPKEVETSYLTPASQQMVHKSAYDTNESSRSASGSKQRNSQHKSRSDPKNLKSNSNERDKDRRILREEKHTNEYDSCFLTYEPSRHPEASGCEGRKTVNRVKPSPSLFRRLQRPQRQFLNEGYLREANISEEVQSVPLLPRARVLSLEKRSSAS